VGGGGAGRESYPPPPPICPWHGASSATGHFQEGPSGAEWGQATEGRPTTLVMYFASQRGPRQSKEAVGPLSRGCGGTRQTGAGTRFYWNGRSLKGGRVSGTPPSKPGGGVVGGTPRLGRFWGGNRRVVGGLGPPPPPPPPPPWGLGSVEGGSPG